MAIDANILLQGRVPDIRAPLQSYQQGVEMKNERELQPLRNQLLQAQTVVAQQESEKQKALFQLGDAATDATMIKPVLASDPQRALQMIDSRVAKIQARGGDPSNTLAVKQLIANGQYDQANKELDTVIQAAAQHGAIKLPEQQQQYAPSSLGKLIMERDSLPQGDPRRAAYDAMIKKESYIAPQMPKEPSVRDNFRVVGGRLIDISSGKPVDVTPSGATSTKPLPVALQKLEGDDIEAIQTANSIQADLGAVKAQIDSGSLDLGPVKNFWNEARNTAGMSSEESRKLATLKASLEKLRNDSLRLNKGVQTDGDAQRAWNELVKNINDPKLVSERIAEIQSINERGAALKAQQINKRRADNGVAPIDDFAQFQVSPAIGGKKGKYKAGDIIEHGGQRYRVTGGDPNDPDVEPI